MGGFSLFEVRLKKRLFVESNLVLFPEQEVFFVILFREMGLCVFMIC